MVISDPEAIAGFVRVKAAGAIRIGVETGPTATWLWTELKRHGLPVICIDALRDRPMLCERSWGDRNFNMDPPASSYAIMRAVPLPRREPRARQG